MNADYSNLGIEENDEGAVWFYLCDSTFFYHLLLYIFDYFNIKIGKVITAIDKIKEKKGKSNDILLEILNLFYKGLHI